MKYTNASKEYVSEIFQNSKGFHTDIECPKCKGHMVVREGKTKFLGCSNYPKCDTMMGITQTFERGDMVGLHNAAFSNSAGLFKDKDGFREDSTWEEDLSQCYPNGIHCKDDM